MKSSTLAALTMGCALSIVTATNAFATVETFNWALTGLSPSLGYAPLQGGGTLTAASNGDGSWTVDAVTGEVGGLTISGVTNFFLSDNLVYPAGLSQVSTGGFAFVTDTGVDVDIFSFFAQGSAPSGNAYGEETSIGFGVGTFAMSAAVGTTGAAPEPSTWAMMTLGFAGLGLLAYRRAKAPAAA
jgi:PEP-CTERM motif